MIKQLHKLYYNDVVRYIFFGGCTTLTNMSSFYLLRKMQVPLNIANILSIILAVAFAYIVNSKYVFHDDCKCLRDHLRPLQKFVSARAVTMALEVGGLWLFVEKLHMHEMLGKFMIQFAVVILNYIFSKFFVFTTGKKTIRKGR